MIARHGADHAFLMVRITVEHSHVLALDLVRIKVGNDGPEIICVIPEQPHSEIVMNTIRLLLSVSITLFGQVFSAHRGCSLPSSPSLNFMIARARAPVHRSARDARSSILSFLRTDAIRLPNALNWTPIVKAVLEARRHEFQRSSSRNSRGLRSSPDPSRQAPPSRRTRRRQTYRRQGSLRKHRHGVYSRCEWRRAACENPANFFGKGRSHQACGREPG